ncbi:F-box/LRR-repeat protein 15 [Cocos nucifera]|uniref:F-box/LRR-repeat protein 15 n=1 Tax=Cocos nucifera TaxID=13894 RepID=A0A8K0I9Q1_COCNU|nr:F-box/LRR-repeat protein 15 [Cocos nucifera]
MADGRMKAVVDDDSSMDGDDEIGRADEDEEEYDKLELELSIGRWGWKGGMPMDGGRREWFPQMDQNVGSSRFFERQAAARQAFPHRQPVADPALRFWGEDLVATPFARVGPAGLIRLDDETILETERAMSDRERDNQHKRPKVLASLEACDYAAASSSGAEVSSQQATGEYTIQGSSVLSDIEMASYLSLSSNDDGDGRPRESNDGGGADGGGGRNIEDVEVRMDLTDDLLHLIFSFLGQKDLCRAGATCKQWLVASTHEDFWRCLKFVNTGISQQNFVAICRRYPNATELNMSGIPNADVLVMEAMTSLRHLETLILDKGQLGDAFFHALTDCPALTNLKISDASLGNGIQEITVYHDRLRDLQIWKCRALRISVRCPQLQTLSLKRTSMAHALLSCPQLHELDLSSCHKLSDAVIRSAATSCPLLASLDMSSCSCVSDETLREIAFACPNLCILDASNCPNISFESVRLPMLIDLKLQSCEGITSASMSAISHSRMLEALQLDNCALLTSISLDLPHLRNISLVHLRKFVDLNLRSPVLSCINVSRCSALHRISITSNSLQKLALQKQESLATLSLQCHNLQEVDLTECESLTNSICEVFSDGGGCPMLRSLVLDNCESLSTIGLNSSSLVSLSLAGCRGMTFLELSCPNLQKINLDGCDHLERASFCPVGLESLNLGICPKLSILRIEAPKMSNLELKGCGVLSQASINCPLLTSLDASFCRQLVDDSLSMTAASCPHIESLILSSCLSIGFGGLSSLHWLRRLTLLDLSYTFLMNLRPVFDTCSQLTTLKLSACKYLIDSSLDALYKEGALPALCELDLSYSSIGQSAITELLACCTNLVHVNLNGCANMHELVWGSNDFHSLEMPNDVCPPNLMFLKKDNEAFRKSEHLLETLNCTGCPNIKKVLIPTMAHCFHVFKINLNLSANLKEVDLACFNLSTLNLSNCSSLEILKLDCPKLTNLQLLACNMLAVEEVEVAVSNCTMLETLNVHSCPKINAEDIGRLRVVCPSLKRIQSGQPMQ